jgi:hypothetical protein
MTEWFDNWAAIIVVSYLLGFAVAMLWEQKHDQ